MQFSLSSPEITRGGKAAFQHERLVYIAAQLVTRVGTWSKGVAAMRQQLSLPGKI